MQPARCHEIALIAVVLGVVLAMAGCTPAPPPEPDQREPAPAARWSELAVDEKALPSGTAYAVNDAVPADEGVPGLYVGATITPGGRVTATVWRIGGSLLGTPTEVELPGASSTITSVAAAAGRTVIVGHYWESGRDIPFVRESTDRRTWTELSIPSEVVDRALYPRDVVVLPDGTALAMCVDPSGEHAAALNLDSGEIHALPERAGVELSTIVHMETHGSEVFALLSGDRVGSGGLVIPYRSSDGGRTWGTTGPLPGKSARVRGISRIGEELIATGFAARAGDQRPASWSWRNGRGWEAEEAVDWDLSDGWDAWYGAPAVVDGVLYAPVVDSSSLETTVAARDADGTWLTLATLPRWSGPYPALRLHADGKRLRAVRTGWGALETGTIDAEGTWTSTGSTESVRVPVEDWGMVGVDGGRALLVGASHTATTSATGWSTGLSVVTFATGKGRLAAQEWRPKGARHWYGLEVAGNGAGRTVLLGTDSEVGKGKGHDDVAAMVRDKGGTWRQATGLSGPESEWLAKAVWTGREWVAIGGERRDRGAGHQWGAVWTSEDGQHWQRAPGPFNVAEDRDSWLDGACALPDGSLLVVGGIERPGKSSQPLAFRRTGGKWQRHDLSGLPDDITGLDGCAVVGDRVVVRGSAAQWRTWTTTDAVTFEPVEIGDLDDEVADIVTVAGGFVGVGMLASGTASQPVLWLSVDGTRWHPVPVPVDHPVTADSVVVWGDRVLVALTSAPGPAVFVLDNPAELLAAL